MAAVEVAGLGRSWSVGDGRHRPSVAVQRAVVATPVAARRDAPLVLTVARRRAHHGRRRRRRRSTTAPTVRRLRATSSPTADATTSTGSTCARSTRPPGELLCRFATVNDVHFGEIECGVLDETQPDLGPILHDRRRASRRTPS